MISEEAKALNKIFTYEVVEFLKNNKEHITYELLTEMRSFGNAGKQLAVDILDFVKDPEQFYLDAFGNRITFNGNRQLKKQFTKLNLSPIHIEELERCSNDIHYFKDNYIKIRTKAGVNYPELRNYQNEFIDTLIPDENESVIGLMGRQSGKSISTGIYLCHQYNFNKDLNIGIVANKGAMAIEFLSNVKNMFLELPIWMQQGTLVWNQRSVKNESNMRILTDVPSSDSFRGYSIHILVIDENAFIRPNIWDAFADSIFPAQSGLSWKKNISISTANGMNFFYNLVKGAREGVSGTKIFEVDWRDVPRYDTDGSIMEPEKFKEKIVKKYGVIYFEQNYGNNFIGSSHTLVNSNSLEEFESIEPLELRDGKLKIYKYPEKGHQYICAVDSAKDGIDDFSVQIVDITGFKFEQVASAQLQIDYLLMPEYINDWCEYYNKPYLIIENNEGSGQSIADQMKITYEYENLHYDTKIESNSINNTKSRKKYPGFRTTPKSRKLILQTLKLFIDNKNLKIYDKKTINQFYTFILINNKYQADENCKDDAVMSLAMIFAPFCSSRNFEDMKGLVDRLYNTYEPENPEDTEDSETKNFINFLSIGSFDDGTDIEIEEQKTYNGFIMEPDGFY